jgi:tetratricopeptide (TPR) repeat protein
MHHPLRRYLIAGLALLACLFGIRTAWRMGLARTLSQFVANASSLPPQYQVNAMAAADEAVRLAQSDPESHYARGIALVDAGRAADAIKEFGLAATLRPRDYKIWLKLGSTCEDTGDDQGALAAYHRAVQCAPAYAQPRWQFGNLLLRMGRTEEAFAEMRRAAESDPTLLPALIDLAWGVFKADAAAVKSAIQPRSTDSRLMLAKTFARRGKPAEAVALFREAGDMTAAGRRELVTELITAKHFSEAYEVWSSGRDIRGGDSKDGIGAITDGGFEGEINLDESGFGWQLRREQPGVATSRDTAQPRTGVCSLRVEWKGTSDPSEAVLSQLVLVQPNTRYQLRFAVRTEEIVAGGLPLIVVTDVSGSAAHPLASSAAFPAGTNGWQELSLEFVTGDTTRSVLITLQRQNCPSGPCPIFGRLWLDTFTLGKPKGQEKILAAIASGGQTASAWNREVQEGKSTRRVPSREVRIVVRPPCEEVRNGCINRAKLVNSLDLPTQWISEPIA